MNEYELMKLSEKEDEAINLYDFLPEQIEMLEKLKAEALAEFKKSYFEFYNDVKDSSLKKQDW